MAISPNDARFSFEASPTLEELITQQGKGPVADIKVLRGGWPEDEAVEDFIVETFILVPYDRSLCSTWAWVIAGAQGERFSDRLHRRMDRRDRSAVQPPAGDP